jgi:ubiquinone/menaquinone biosynthesis C-methylase UbiE
VYTFLSFILSQQPEGLPGKSVLDCGAGGAVPPLAIFAEQGFEAWGIDISEEQLQRASAFCEARDIILHLQKGDMRHIPFEDGAFDYVYEQYAMCHLTKQGTKCAVQEMRRVLKAGGFCFLGLISKDTWPPLGCETEPGEFWSDHGDGPVLHSAYTDAEADQILAGWVIIQKEKRTTWFCERTAKMSLETWMTMYDEVKADYSEEAWQAAYEERVSKTQYAHLYYILQKPA